LLNGLTIQAFTKECVGNNTTDITLPTAFKQWFSITASRNWTWHSPGTLNYTVTKLNLGTIRVHASGDTSNIDTYSFIAIGI
jgi:hypothetical protein